MIKKPRHCLRKVVLLYLFYYIFHSNCVNNVLFYVLCLVSWSQTKLGREWFLAIKIECIRKHLSISSLHFAFIVHQPIKINSGLWEFHKKTTIGRHLAASRWSGSEVSPFKSVVFFICLSARSEILLQRFYERNFRLDGGFWFIVQFSHRTTVACCIIRFLGWLSPPVLRWYLLFKGDKYINKVKRRKVCGFSCSMCMERLSGYVYYKSGIWKAYSAFWLLSFSMASWIAQERWQVSLLTSNGFELILTSYEGYRSQKLFGWWNFTLEVWLMLHSEDLHWCTHKCKQRWLI